MSQGLELVEALNDFLDHEVGPEISFTQSHDPGRRVKLVWPPESVSHSYHLSAKDFKGRVEAVCHGFSFEVETAATVHGVFGRCVHLWNDAKGATEKEMLERLVKGMEPMVLRLKAISETLGAQGVVSQPIKDMSPVDLIKLLYCRDRDVAMEARTAIESRASSLPILPAFLAILRDQRHPLRRSPQWCVLDMLEDLPAFAKTQEESDEAVAAIRELMWDAPDDYCRTIYKAGVVLGGHICTPASASALLDLLHAPSRVARRSAAHAVFHLVEWMPETRETIVTALRRQASEEPEPLLAEFQLHMARDIEAGAYEHVTEPVFPDEAA
jgi:hypothetical protein